MANESEISVQTEIVKLLKRNTLEAHINDIDDIVLSYVISTLEVLGDNENDRDCIDVDQFVEVMDAYIPGFANIDRDAVHEWMFQLSAQLSKANATSNKPQLTVDSKLSAGACISPEVGVVCGNNTQKSHVHSVAESDTPRSLSGQVDDHLGLLVEMFPDTLQIEIEQCFSASHANVEKAVQLILHRQETGTAITEDRQPRMKKKDSPDNDKNAKGKLLEKYSFIDIDEDKKQFKPSLPKSEPKKLVRYLDNQVVNVKGQRFTEINTKDDAEEIKKTYINLKPARKYRFH